MAFIPTSSFNAALYSNAALLSSSISQNAIIIPTPIGSEGSDSNSSTSRKSDSASSSPAARKVVNPFDPEATVPLPFQLDDQFGPYSTSVWKRNERERCRVRCVNEGYDRLRNHLPLANNDKRISKVDTLRLAIRYIRHLDAMLQRDDHVYHCRCFVGFQEESEGNIRLDMTTRGHPRNLHQ
ncbi:hypothetical protein WR25_11044 [Diploscapter pachys]|uniref:BHLH domain-containing protein n=1 Tax=Diploscapter pachys TaxID=2018661 RepID=A0A2A2LTI1_9BILA|nr:hypothetical protein WR25_11044 [Diploscapter pachys]